MTTSRLGLFAPRLLVAIPQSKGAFAPSRISGGWSQGLAGMALALALRSSLASAVECRDQLPATQVVWTGPKVEGSYLRSTREVVRELLRDARQDILVIGYWIAARDEGEGIIEEVITSLGIAVRRGVEVTVIVDERRATTAATIVKLS